MVVVLRAALASFGGIMKIAFSRAVTRLRIVAAAFCWATGSFGEGVTHMGTVEWASEEVIGVSGLDISADGLRFSAVADRGWFLRGQLKRKDGELSGVEVNRILPLLSGDGHPVSARRTEDQADAEGLAVAEDGSFWVSFERWAHVSRYASPSAAAEWIEDHPDFARMRDNRQLEALALHPDGGLYTFPENPLSGSFPVYVLRDATWEIVGQIDPSDRFAVVGADFGEDGTLYLLERKLVVGLWWQNRLRRFEPGTFGTGEVLWTSNRGEFGNLEGISLWSAPDGLRILLVSDNNGRRGVPTQFVEFLTAP